MASFITFLKLIALVASWNNHNCGPYLPCPRSLECNTYSQVCSSQSQSQNVGLKMIKPASNFQMSIYPDAKYLFAIQPLELRTYLKISISLCTINSNWEIIPSFLKQIIADFDENEISHRLNTYSQQINGKCSVFTFERIAFLQKQENQSENLLIIINSQQQQSQLAIVIVQERYERVYLLYHFGNIALIITAILSLLLLIWMKYGKNQGERGSQGQILIEDTLESQINYFNIYLPIQKFKQLKVHDNICPICLIKMEENDMVRQTPCLHLFHVACLDSWCANRRICPICRCSLAKNHILTLIDKEEAKEEVNNLFHTRTVQLKDYCDKGILQEML